MKSIFKNSPTMLNRNLIRRIILLILCAVSPSFLIAPVIVDFLSDFTRSENSLIFDVFKVLFALTLVFCSVLCFISRKISFMVLPGLFGTITALFSLFKSIGEYKNIKSIADKFSISQDYTSYLISMGIYLAYAILCILTLLYACGYFRIPVVVYVLTTVAFLATIFITIDKALNSDESMFQIITFASSSIPSLIPAIIVSCTHKSIIMYKKQKRTEQ